MYWDQLTSTQLGKMDKDMPVILPVAATEQHGPHLPVSTDRMIGEHFCQELDKILTDRILILPTIAVGASEHHLDFAGSLSVKHQTLQQTLIDIAGSVAHHGFTNIMVFNSHGGNQAIGQSFVEVFGYRHPECKVFLITWWRIAQGELKSISDTGSGGTGHAGEFETSLMLLIAPHLVHKDLIPAKANLPNYHWATGDLLTGPQASHYRRMRELTPTGTLGEPSKATLSKGQEITKVVVSALRSIVEDINPSS